MAVWHWQCQNKVVNRSVVSMTISLLIAASKCPADVNLDFVHLSWLKIFFLGIVQGITELLPISSTAHLRVVPALLGWEDPGSAFSAAMQLASFIAVVSYFWHDIKSLTGATVKAITDKDYESHDFRLVMGILVGTLPIVIAGILLSHSLNKENSPLRQLVVIGAACIVMSVLLASAEKFGKRDRAFSELSLKDGILVGIAQAFALIPGVSRSGSTLTASLFLGMERETAAKFCFLLGLPAITLAGAKELHLLRACLDLQGWTILLFGLAVASISAFVAIYGLLHYLEKQSTWIFVFYRFFMGVFLIVGVMTGFLHN